MKNFFPDTKLKICVPIHITLRHCCNSGNKSMELNIFGGSVGNLQKSVRLGAGKNIFKVHLPACCVKCFVPHCSPSIQF